MASRLLRWGAPTTYIAAVLVIGLTLIGLLVRSPDTKANYQASPGGYDRTEVAVLGPDEPFEGLLTPLGDVSLQTMYVGAGCAGCHGLKGEGGVVGPEIWGHDLDDMRTALRDGEFGMPAYDSETLTERQIGALTTYLNDLRRESGADADSDDSADRDGAP